MADERKLLRRTAELAAGLLETLDERPIAPTAGVEELRASLGGPLPAAPSDPLHVIEERAKTAEPVIVGILSALDELAAPLIVCSQALDQVLLRFADDDTTKAVVGEVPASGGAWMAGKMGGGRAAIRLSVSNWRGTERDIEGSLAAFRSAPVGR